MRSPGLNIEAGAVAPGAAGRSLVPASVLALVIGLLLALGAGFGPAWPLGPIPAVAHTDLLQASPGPGQRAGGEIDFVDLAFLEPVSDVQVEVVQDGSVVPGSMTVSDGSIARFAFDEPLTKSGQYDVSYSLTSYDLDATSGSFTFTFEPDAPQARRIGTIEPEGRNWVPIGATAALIAVALGLAFIFLSRLEAKRRVAPSSVSSPDKAEPSQVDH